MIRLKKETYDYKEVAEMLSIKPKHIKKLVVNGVLKAVDIREIPDPDRLDIRFLRILKSSLNEFFRNRIVCKPPVKTEEK